MDKTHNDSSANKVIKNHESRTENKHKRDDHHHSDKKIDAVDDKRFKRRSSSRDRNYAVKRDVDRSRNRRDVSPLRENENRNREEYRSRNNRKGYSVTPPTRRDYYESRHRERNRDNYSRNNDYRRKERSSDRKKDFKGNDNLLSPQRDSKSAKEKILNEQKKVDASPSSKRTTTESSFKSTKINLDEVLEKCKLFVFIIMLLFNKR